MPKRMIKMASIPLISKQTKNKETKETIIKKQKNNHAQPNVLKLHARIILWYVRSFVKVKCQAAYF